MLYIPPLPQVPSEDTRNDAFTATLLAAEERKRAGLGAYVRGSGPGSGYGSGHGSRPGSGSGLGLGVGSTSMKAAWDDIDAVAEATQQSWRLSASYRGAADAGGGIAASIGGPSGKARPGSAALRGLGSGSGSGSGSGLSGSIGGSSGDLHAMPKSPLLSQADADLIRKGERHRESARRAQDLNAVVKASTGVGSAAYEKHIREQNFLAQQVRPTYPM